MVNISLFHEFEFVCTDVAMCDLLHDVETIIISPSLTDNCNSLRERLRTHKVFTKDQCFYLNYHKFYIKSYVVDVY